MFDDASKSDLSCVIVDNIERLIGKYENICENMYDKKYRDIFSFNLPRFTRLKKRPQFDHPFIS